jgi:hypothetical protein
MEQGANSPRILARNSQLFSHLLMMQLRQRLCRLDAQAVQIQILRVLPAFKQSLRVCTDALAPMVISENSITSIFSEFFAAKKSEMHNRRPSRVFFSAVNAIPSSSMVNAITAAP